ncbi:hypothetical protein B7463_g3641, partial [Scytalidium lignicola]
MHFNEAIIKAAMANTEYRNDIMQLLLDFNLGKKIQITEETIVEIVAAEEFSMEMIRRLVEQVEGVSITTNIIKAAAERLGDVVDVMELLLSHSQSVEITADMLETATRAWGVGAEMLKLLLQHGGDASLTQNVVEKLLAYVDNDEMVLLLRRCTDFQTTEGTLKAVAMNQEKIQFLLGYAEDIHIDQELVEKVYAGSSRIETMKLLLNHSGVSMTQSAAEAIAAHFDKKVMEILLRDFGGIQINQKMIEAAAGNRNHSKELIQFLLPYVPDVKITKEIVEKIVSNGRDDIDVLKLFLDRRRTRAYSRDWRGIQITEAAVQGIMAGGRKELVELLLRRQRIHITEELFLTALRNPWMRCDNLQSLLGRANGLKITKEMLNIAVKNLSRGAVIWLDETSRSIIRALHDREILEKLFHGSMSRDYGAEEALNGLRTILLLLERATEVWVSEELIDILEEHYCYDRELLQLFLRQSEKLILTEAAVKRLLGPQGRQLFYIRPRSHAVYDVETLCLLLRQVTSFTVTAEIIRLVADSKEYSIPALCILLNQTADVKIDVQITRDIIDALQDTGTQGKGLLFVLLSQDRGITITDDGLQRIFEKYDRETVQFVLSEREIEITEDLITSAAKNSNDGPSIMNFLLRPNKTIELTKDIIKAARGNPEVVHQLLSHVRQIEITKSIAEEVMGNWMSHANRDAMKLLLQHNDVQITHDAIEAIAAHCSKDIVELSFKIFGDCSITDNVILAAVRNREHGGDVIKFLVNKSQDIKITQAMLKEAVADSNRKSVVLALLVHAKDIQITEDIMEVAAAHFDEEIMALLLRQEASAVTEGVILAAAGAQFFYWTSFGQKGSGTRKETMQLLLRNAPEIKITEDIILEAAKNPFTRPEVMQILLSHSNSVKISEEIIEAAAHNQDHGVEVMRMLLRRAPDFEVTLQILKAAAQNSKEITQILGNHSRDIVISEEVLKVAARNEKDGDQVIQLLLEYAPDTNITKELVNAALGNKKRAYQIMKTLLIQVDQPEIPEEAVIAIAAISDKSIMELLLIYHRETQITEEIIRAAAGNEEDGEGVIKLLLKQARGVRITEDALKAAVGNRKKGKQVTRQLMTHQQDLHISPSVIQQAVKNSGCGQAVLEQLLEREWKIQITRDIVRAAVMNRSSGDIMIQALLSQDRETQITEDAIKMITSKLNAEYAPGTTTRTRYKVSCEEKAMRESKSNTQSHPSERDTMTERELDSFSDLAVVTSFIQSLSALLPLPPVNLKNAKLYVSKSKELAAELDSLKTQVDLSDFAVPIDNLLEPGMAESALNALDRFIANKTGTKMRMLYQNLIEDCISDIQDKFEQQKAKLNLASPAVTPAIETCTTDVQVQQRRQKQKTHSTHSSAHDITLTLTSHPEVVQTPPIFKVKQDTIDVFSTLFLPLKSRGSISWTAFETAMTDLKFSVEPKFGSSHSIGLISRESKATSCSFLRGA